MNIDLTRRQKQLIEEKVKSGSYALADEVVREGLRLLEVEDERRRRVAWFQNEVEKGFAGPATPWTAKDSDRIRKLVTREARRKR